MRRLCGSSSYRAADLAAESRREDGDRSPAFNKLALVSVPGRGTEDVLVGPDGRIFTGLEDGRIVSVTPDGRRVEVVGDTGGRPLGLEWHPEGWMIVCDAHRGLLRLDVLDGRIDELVTEFGGVPMRFCNNAAVADDGSIYFSDSSQRFTIEHWRADLFEHSATGRLFRRAPNGRVDLLASDLAFANGVALTSDRRSIVVAETAAYRLRRYPLSGSAAGQIEPFVDGLAGFPDNISTGSDGLIWVALASARNALLDRMLPLPGILRRAAWRLPETVQPKAAREFEVHAYDDTGRLTYAFRGTHPEFHFVTGVREQDGTVWLGSLEDASIASFVP
jgi:sugar lactone lactonase YvrE